MEGASGKPVGVRNGNTGQEVGLAPAARDRHDETAADIEREAMERERYDRGE